MRKVLFCCAVLVFGSCASDTRLAAGVRSAISARHSGKTVELRQSCYYGDLYDENEMWLLSPYPFAQTFHIVDTDGTPIHPQNQRGIIPAGSAFVVERVEFPDAIAMSKRMLTTPRYNPWVYLKPAEGTAAAPLGRKRFILLLSMDLNDEAAVERALGSVLAPAGQMKRWLETRRPTVRAAIENKDVVMGMSVEELTAAMGPPQRWIADKTSFGDTAQVAWYPSTEVWMIAGAVVEVRPGRPLEAVSQPARPESNPKNAKPQSDPKNAKAEPDSKGAKPQSGPNDAKGQNDAGGREGESSPQR